MSLEVNFTPAELAADIRRELEQHPADARQEWLLAQAASHLYALAARVADLEEALSRAHKYESERWHTRGCARTGSGCWVEDDFALLAATGKEGT